MSIDKGDPAIDGFIARMNSVFGEPKTDNVEAYLAEVTKALTGWTAATLEKAGDHLLRKVKFFPKPAEIIEVCQEIVAQSGPAPERKGDQSWTRYALLSADRLIQCEMGRVAARENWITGLHDFCRKNLRLPDAIEAQHIKREAHEFDKAYSSVARGEGGVLTVALRGLGDSMLRKRDRLSALANGDASAASMNGG